MKNPRLLLIIVFAILTLSGSIILIYYISQNKVEELAEEPVISQPEKNEVEEPVISHPDSREVVMRFIEAYNKRDTIALEKVLADPVALNGEEYEPATFIKNSWKDRLWKSFPDAQIHPTHIVADNHHVTLRAEGEMTGEGEYLGYDVDGKTIRISEMSLFLVQNGQIVEWWYENDMLGFWEQLGLVENPLSRR